MLYTDSCPETAALVSSTTKILNWISGRKHCRKIILYFVIELICISNFTIRPFFEELYCHVYMQYVAHTAQRKCLLHSGANENWNRWRYVTLISPQLSMQVWGFFEAFPDGFQSVQGLQSNFFQYMWGFRLAFVDGTWAVFKDKDFWMFSWDHTVIAITALSMLLMQCSLVAWIPQASNIDFPPWDFSWFY